MSQGAVSVANGTFPSVRAAINAALAALSSQQKGNTAPASVPAGTAWVDDSGTNWVLKIYDGSDWIAALTIDPTNNRVVSNDAQGDDLASAATTNIGGATGQFLRVTGTTAITGLGTAPAGTTRFVQFTGALTLTHNSTSLILPGAANITTAAGDVAAFVSLGSGNWKCLFYQKADGTPVVSAGTGTITYANLSPGMLVNRVEAELNTILTFAGGGAHQIPQDDTIPQSNEGDEFLTVSITPKASSHILDIHVVVCFCTSAASNTAIAVFRDSGANAVKAIAAGTYGGGAVVSHSLRFQVSAGSTSATTFRVRIGNNGASTSTTINGTGSGAQLYGGVAGTSITVLEIKN